MPRVSNVFHNIVTDENSTTELLCNLLQFEDFRVQFLELILPGIDSSEIAWDHIETQIDHADFGRPDIQIRNGSVLAFIEVKVVAGLDTTVNQPRDTSVSIQNWEIESRSACSRKAISKRLPPQFWGQLEPLSQEARCWKQNPPLPHSFE